MLISSPILAGDRGMGIPDEAMGDAGAGAGPSGAAGGSGAAGTGFEFGVDPSLDPELAMVSLSFTSSVCLLLFTNTDDGGRHFVCRCKKNRRGKPLKSKHVDLQAPLPTQRQQE
jgi:hypothetical protein